MLRSVLMGESSVLDDSDEEFDSSDGGEEQEQGPGLDGGDMGEPFGDDDDEEENRGGMGGVREDVKGSERMGRPSTSTKARETSANTKDSTNTKARESSTNTKASATSTNTKASTRAIAGVGKDKGEGRGKGLSIEDYME